MLWKMLHSGRHLLKDTNRNRLLTKCLTHYKKNMQSKFMYIKNNNPKETRKETSPIS